jgi:trigger factor
MTQQGTPSMSTGEQERDPSASTSVDDPGREEAPAPDGEEPKEGEEPKHKLDLDVQITEAGPCRKHVKVAIARTDVDRQFDESLGEVKRDAAIPGFRPGHAPRQLVEKRFRKEVTGQVKSALLLACMEQLDEDYKLNPITQPNLDLEAIELPDDGPMRFEMEIEVQPDFPLPSYKQLTIKRLVRSIEETDVDAQLTSFLERHAQMVPKLQGGAEIGDFVTAHLRFHKDGVILNEAKEIQFRLQPELRFQDGSVANAGEVLSGSRPGDAREAEADIGLSSPDPALRGQTIRVSFQVLDLKFLRMPEVNTAFLRSIGFDSLDELRTVVREVLERRLLYQQRQAMRRQILDQLIEQTPFDLPADLVDRQEKSILRRRVLELRESGLSDSDIRAREAEIRANAHAATLQTLKEFFLLSRIAEAENIKIEPEDLEMEIDAIASRTDESPRRVRAKIEKEGMAETIASQILERKTIDLILETVTFEEVPLVEEKTIAVETLDQTAAAPQPEPESDAKTESEPGADTATAPAEPAADAGAATAQAEPKAGAGASPP